MSSSIGGVFFTIFTTAALGAVVFYLLQRLKVTEAHLALLDQKSRQNVDVGEVKSLLRKEIPNLRHLFPTQEDNGEAGPPRVVAPNVCQKALGKAAKATTRLTFGAASPVQGPVRRLEEEDDQQEEEKVEAPTDSTGSD